MSETNSKTRGWYVDLPRELVDAFDKAFPVRGAKHILTEAAIRKALAIHERLCHEGRGPKEYGAELAGGEKDGQEPGEPG